MGFLTRLLGTGCMVAVLSVGPAAQDQEQVYVPGKGITSPILVKEVKPVYTREAREARIEGTVMLEAVVLTTGEVGDVEITESLDTEYGLDEQAVKAVKQWEFKPGTKDGKPVPVRVEIEMTFTLRRNSRAR